MAPTPVPFDGAAVLAGRRTDSGGDELCVSARGLLKEFFIGHARVMVATFVTPGFAYSQSRAARQRRHSLKRPVSLQSSELPGHPRARVDHAGGIRGQARNQILAGLRLVCAVGGHGVCAT